jgi:uncharacterized protein YbjT (DUF2867 family)
MILVTGATGNIGGEVVKQLLAKGAPVRVLARDPAKAARLGAVEIVQGDLGEPETLGPAFAGVSRVFLAATGPDLARLEGHAIEAARKAGVAHVVKLSAWGVGLEPSILIGRWHQESEETLQASGMSWTMVRPSGFASNALNWAGMIKGQGAVFAPTGDGLNMPVHPRDIAAVSVAALTAPGHEGQVYLLTGPEALTTAQQVAVISAAIDRPLRFVDVPPEAARKGMLESGMPATLAEAILELAALIRAGRGSVLSSTVADVLGRPALTFASWVNENVAAFR